MFGALTISASVHRKDQTEAEFQKLMPITGKVETYFGEFDVDHSFPTNETANRISELMEHQRAAKFYLWSLAIVATARIRYSLNENLEGLGPNRFATIRRFNERRGFLSVNESTVYFLAVSDTSKSGAVLDVPSRKIDGMVIDSLQESPADIGLFSPQSSQGGRHQFVGANRPVDTIPDNCEH